MAEVSALYDEVGPDAIRFGNEGREPLLRIGSVAMVQVGNPTDPGWFLFSI
jgi:hypothetical protein